MRDGLDNGSVPGRRRGAAGREFITGDCRRLGVEPGEGHMLSYTSLYGPCPPAELIRVFGYKPSTLTGMLDRLEEKGLVVRDPNPEDRRSFLIRVTAEGASIAARLRRRLEEFAADVRERVGARDERGFSGGDARHRRRADEKERDVPGGGRIAQSLDPQGAAFAVFQPGAGT